MNHNTQKQNMENSVLENPQWIQLNKTGEPRQIMTGVVQWKYFKFLAPLFTALRVLRAPPGTASFVTCDYNKQQQQIRFSQSTTYCGINTSQVCSLLLAYCMWPFTIKMQSYMSTANQYIPMSLFGFTDQFTPKLLLKHCRWCFSRNVHSQSLLLQLIKSSKSNFINVTNCFTANKK